MCIAWHIIDPAVRQMVGCHVAINNHIIKCYFLSQSSTMLACAPTWHAERQWPHHHGIITPNMSKLNDKWPFLSNPQLLRSLFSSLSNYSKLRLRCFVLYGFIIWCYYRSYTSIRIKAPVNDDCLQSWDCFAVHFTVLLFRFSVVLRDVVISFIVKHNRQLPVAPIERIIQKESGDDE